MNVTSREEYRLELSKREFVLVTKGLCGKLRPEESSEAVQLGLDLISRARERMAELAACFEHAWGQAAEIDSNE